MLMEAGIESVDAGGRESLFLSDPRCCHFSLSPHSLLLQLLPCYFFLYTSPLRDLQPRPSTASKTPEEPSWSGQPPCPPSRTAQHRSQQRMLSWVEASKDASPTAAQQGRQVSLLPPQGSFIVTINRRKQNGHHELQYGLDLSEFSWDGDTAWQTADLNRSFRPGKRLRPAQERLGLQTQLWGLSHLHRVPQLLWLPLPN